jgi:hypothetical protein
MRQDALDCVQHVRDVAPGCPMFLFGTRWGALIAASAASTEDGAGLVVWEPFLQASRFFKEAFRNRLVKDMRDGVETPQTSKQLEDQLRAGVPVEVPAHRIQPMLFESSLGRSLSGELGTSRRPILAVQVGPTGEVRHDLAVEVDTWRDAGLDVETAAVRDEEAWWLIRDEWLDEGERPTTRELVGVTRGWLEAHTTEVSG